MVKRACYHHGKPFVSGADSNITSGASCSSEAELNVVAAELEREMEPPVL